MIGIYSIASYYPKTYRDNFKLAKQFNESENFVRKRVGGEVLPTLAPEMETSDMAVRAIQRLIDKTGTNKNDIDCLVLCTQNPDGNGLPHTSAIVQKKANLKNRLAAFDVSLGCSGYVYGLNIIQGFMEVANLSKGILVTADPYSKIVDPEDKNTVMLFGDAATATLLTREKPVFKIGRSLLYTDGSGAVHLKNCNGRLHMNGRQVFNFAATEVPQQIKALLSLEKIGIEEVDRFILHQGSRFIVETIARKLKIDSQKVPIYMKLTGNTVSSSIPLVLESVIPDEMIQTVLLSGFGVGWSWGSMLISRVN
jgi:3-oxoacyl-[acyl-carrier-protein] synthase-3